MKSLHKWTIHQYIYKFQQATLGRMLHQLFKLKSAPTPYGLVGLPADSLCQFSKAFRLKHWVAAREGYIGKGVCLDRLHDFFRAHHAALADVPRLRVVTAWTCVGASGTIDGSPEARTIHHCVFYYV